VDFDGQLQAELDALATRIGHNLSIDDPHGRLIAYSAHSSGADPVRIASILARQVAPEILAWQDLHGIATSKAPVVVPANSSLGMTARLCVPIRQDSRCLGYLWVLDDSLSPAGLVAVMDFVRRLASDPAQDVNGLVGRLPASFDQLAAAVPSLLQSEVRMCAVVPDDALTGLAYRRLVSTIPAALRGNSYVGSFVSPTFAIALLRHPATVPDLTSVVPDCGIGLSDPAPFTAAGVRTARIQALAAAELSALDPALPNPVTWSGLGPYRTLLGAPGVQLSTLDDTGLLTLETYLDFGGDAKRTAAHLHLHRTTLYYRLGRVSAALGVNLDDGLTRLDLHLALKHRRLAGRKISGDL
jgi:PucR family transcriptional regulator, proline-responsive transcriptional activator